MNLKMFLILFSLIVTSPTFAKSWSGSTRYETRKGTDIKQSVIQFSKGRESVIYRPTEPPLGAVDLQKVVFKGKPPFFVSTWASGAHSVVFKVFNPETHGATPVCEHSSFGESTELQIKNNQLELSVYNESSSNVITWEKCGSPFESDREPNSKKTSSPKK